MFSVGITVSKEVPTSHVISTVKKLEWGTLYDSARTHTGLKNNTDYIELHFKDATTTGMEMNNTLQQGNVTLHGWMFSYTMTLDEYKQFCDENRKKRIARFVTDSLKNETIPLST
jgi:hypothetical protein